MTSTEKKEFAEYLIKESIIVTPDDIREGWADYVGDPDDELSEDIIEEIDEMIIGAHISVDFR